MPSPQKDDASRLHLFAGSRGRSGGTAFPGCPTDTDGHRTDRERFIPENNQRSIEECSVTAHKEAAAADDGIRMSPRPPIRPSPDRPVIC